MQRPNPFIPPTPVEQHQAARRARFRTVMMTILGCHAAVLVVVLGFEGCSPEALQVEARTQPETSESATPAPATNAPAATNLPRRAYNLSAKPNSAKPTSAPNPAAAVPPRVPAPPLAVATPPRGVTPPPARPNPVPAPPPIPAPATAPALSQPPIAVQPAKTSTYTVVSGDSLFKIAKAHHTTVKAIRALNGLNSDKLTVGQQLKLQVTDAPETPAAGNKPSTPNGPSGRIP